MLLPLCDNNNYYIYKVTLDDSKLKKYLKEIKEKYSEKSVEYFNEVPIYSYTEPYFLEENQNFQVLKSEKRISKIDEYNKPLSLHERIFYKRGKLKFFDYKVNLKHIPFLYNVINNILKDEGLINLKEIKRFLEVYFKDIVSNMYHPLFTTKEITMPIEELESIFQNILSCINLTLIKKVGIKKEKVLYGKNNLFDNLSITLGNINTKVINYMQEKNVFKEKPVILSRKQY